jgi:hypothetical protein
MIGSNPPASASWGRCDVDYPRESIVSPYPFRTAQAHYEALLAETQTKGGPTVYTRENPPPDWNGRYSRAISLRFVATREGRTYDVPAHLTEPPQWFFTSINQTSTILSLLTPEYRRRTVQMHYHQSVNNAPLWPAQFCWPDGCVQLKELISHAHPSDKLKAAKHCRDDVLPAMLEVRRSVDALEGIVADDLWPLPTYQEMLFIK